jgi:hypothetical protein
MHSQVNLVFTLLAAPNTYSNSSFTGWQWERSSTRLRGLIVKERGLLEGIPRRRPRLNLTPGASRFMGSWLFTGRVWSEF